jgi:hypothetical protein
VLHYGQILQTVRNQFLQVAAILCCITDRYFKQRGTIFFRWQPFCAALRTDISNSEEPFSSGSNSLTTNLSQTVISPPTSRNTNDIPDVVGVTASHTYPEIGVRESERLGIPSLACSKPVL